MRRLERGASYVPLIIVIVLLVVAVVWAWVKTDEADQLTVRVRDIERQLQEESDRRIAAKAYLKELAREIGWPIKNPTEKKPADYGSDYEELDAWIQSQLKGATSLTERFTATFDLSAYSVTENGGIQVDPQEPEKIGYINPSEVPAEANLEYLFGLMLTGMDRMLNDINKMVVQLKAEKNDRATDKKSFEETIAEKDSEISNLRSELAQANSRAATNERALRDQINGLEGRVRQAEDALETVQREARAQLAQMKQELMVASQKVQTLKERVKPKIVRPGPDGEVLSASDVGGVVVLNRGKTNRMMPGLVLMVYSYGKGGVKVEKGRVKVLDVGKATATARILELLSPMNPMVAGDMFESVVYDPQEVLHFYLLGKFRKYGHSDAASRLESLGAVVDEKVTIDTDFLVMGAPASEEESLRDTDVYKQAVELGIPVITEQQLSMFLLY